MITLYGISNCDTVKKARKFLEVHKVDYRFHNFRKDGWTTQQVESWLTELGRESLINKRSRTWKELGPKQKATLDSPGAAALVVNNPTLIKRPLLEMTKGKGCKAYRWF